MELRTTEVELTLPIKYWDEILLALVTRKGYLEERVRQSTTPEYWQKKLDKTVEAINALQDARFDKY